MNIAYWIVGFCSVVFAIIMGFVIFRSRRLKEFAFYIDVLVSGLLLLLAAFLFLGEVVLALVFFVIAIAVSVVALLKVRYGHANSSHEERRMS